jgi:AcrR family transcriptional regulator
MARTPSAKAHAQVLDAALQLISERGIEATSMDAIAERSGVSKATIYKHWRDKDALCLDVLASLHDYDTRAIEDSDDVRNDLIRVLSYRPCEEKADQQRQMMPHLMGYAARNREFAMAWRARVMDPPRRQIIRLLKRGIDEGRLPEDLNIDLSVALLLGPMVIGNKAVFQGLNLPENLGERVVDAFWRAYAVKASPQQKSKLRNPASTRTHTGQSSSRL